MVLLLMELGYIQTNNTRVNGLFLYAALEELWVPRDFASHNYCHHPKYNQSVVLHLFDTSLPTLTEHRHALERSESAVGSIRVHLNMPSPAARNRMRGGGKVRLMRWRS